MVFDWILAILILTGPAKGDFVQLVEYGPNWYQCKAMAALLNKQNVNGDSGPQLEFVCLEDKGGDI